MSAEIELATWVGSDVSGTAVIQMQYSGAYREVRQEITWLVQVEQKNGQFVSRKAGIDVTEKPLPVTQNRIPTPLRIVDSSNGEGDVFKLGYPAKVNSLARKTDDSTTPLLDERVDPLAPPTDWDLKVKAKTK